MSMWLEKYYKRMVTDWLNYFSKSDLEKMGMSKKQPYLKNLVAYISMRQLRVSELVSKGEQLDVGDRFFVVSSTSIMYRLVGGGMNDSDVQFKSIGIKVTPEMADTFLNIEPPKFDFMHNVDFDTLYCDADIEINGLKIRSITWVVSERAFILSLFDPNEPDEFSRHWLYYQMDSNKDITIMTTTNSHNDVANDTVTKAIKFMANVLIYYLNNKDSIPVKPRLDQRVIKARMNSRKASSTGMNGFSLFNIATLDHDWSRVPGGKSAAKRPLQGSVRVTGHWRWQACGKGWSENKLIWIEPFVKGSGRDITKIKAVKI